MDVSKTLDCTSIEEQEIVSRYVGQKLSQEEAEAFEEHYFGCDRCWAEVQAATEVRAALKNAADDSSRRDEGSTGTRILRGPWWNARLLAAAAAVAVIGVTAAVLMSRVPSRTSDSDSLVGELAQAVGSRHSVRARVTGGFRYPEVSRAAGGSAKSPSWKIFAEAEKIKQAAERESSADIARALGLAHLFVGEVDQAVGRLEEAALLAPKEARIHSDLAAAYLVLAEDKDRSDALVRALSEAEAALRLQPDLAEAHFNEALALEAMSLKEKAKQAWKAYLHLDPRSEWAAEARRHLEALSTPRTSRRWEKEEHRLDMAIENGDSAVIQEVLRRFPQQSREHFEQTVLPRWANASGARFSSEWKHQLRQLELFAREQSSATRDSMLTDVMKAVSRVVASGDPPAMARLARGLTHYSRGKDLLDRLDSQKAQVDLDQARTELLRSGNPLSAWADFYRAICLYYSDDFEGSNAECELLRNLATSRGYSNLLGRASWMTGLIHLVRGEVDQAVTDYSLALHCFTATGEKGHVAAVESLISTGLSYLGDARASWMHRLASLRDVDDLDDPRRAHRLFSNAADAAMAEGLPGVALVFQDAALTTASSWKSALILMEAHLYRASILGKLDRQSEAAEELERARRSLADIEDEGIKVGESAALDAEAGKLAIGGRPEEAFTLLSRALDYFRGTKHALRVPEIYLARGRASLKRGDLERAESDFELGIQELEREREYQERFRASFFDSARELFGELIQLEALGRRRPEVALGYAERFRAHGLTSSVSLDPSAIRAHLPPSTALLYFASLRDQLLSWLVSRDQVRFSQRPVGGAELGRRVAIYRHVLEAGSSPGDIQRWASKFYDELIRPQVPFLARSTTLLIVPDGALQELPFASLYDDKSRRYLIEDHPVALAPSAAAFLRSWQWDAGDSADGSPSALAVGNPRFNEKFFPGLLSLPYAEAEARRVAEIYPGSELLVGKAATRDRLLDGAARHAVIHFAGHALASPDYPELSRLVLAPEDSRDGGSLFARDIQPPRFSHVRLVVLAACRSAQVSVSRASGPVSLVGPFLAAGVPQVLGTLWDIDDRVSSSFLVRFHTAFRSGKTPMIALQEAQRASLNSGDVSLRSPATWAAFVFFGSEHPTQKGG